MNQYLARFLIAAGTAGYLDDRLRQPLAGTKVGTKQALVSIEHAIVGLPEGLVLLDVDVHDSGFRVNLKGQDVVLVQGSSS